jgi:hypothetical protein
MTMIPLVIRYIRHSPNLAALGALHSISRRPCRGPDVPITLPLPVRWGRCNDAPAPPRQVERQLVFFHAAPVFGPC